jgi:WD40 repeat protein
VAKRKCGIFKNNQIYIMVFQVPLLQGIAEWLAQKCEWVFEGHTGFVRSVCIFDDGIHIVSGSDDNTVMVWNVLTGECEQTLFGHTDWITSVCVFDKGKCIIAGSMDKTIKIWSIDTWACTHTLQWL